MTVQTPESGLLRSAYLAGMRFARRLLDGTGVLEAWTDRAIRRPGRPLSHLRTLVAVHNADDLVRLDLPWWTYESISILDEFLASRPARVFEYGSGASTLWLARRASSLDSVEHDPGWAEHVEELLSLARDMRCQPVLHRVAAPLSEQPTVSSGSPRARGLEFAPYVSTIETLEGEFDLILVDGRAREACVRMALERVREDGVILLDDAQRPRYQEVLASTESAGWNVLVTRGATPCQPLPRQTALISRNRLSD